MAEFTPKNWLSAGETGANESNSVLSKENMNDLENRIAKFVQELNETIEKINVLSVPLTDIPLNADLNDYTNIGTYRCTDASLSQTLKNNPYKGGAFKLIVEHINLDIRIRQTIYANNQNCNTYVRYYNDNWGSWHLITMTEV